MIAAILISLAVGLAVGAVSGFHFLIWVLTHCDPVDFNRTEYTPERAELARKIRHLAGGTNCDPDCPDHPMRGVLS